MCCRLFFAEAPTAFVFFFGLTGVKVASSSSSSAVVDDSSLTWVSVHNFGSNDMVAFLFDVVLDAAAAAAVETEVDGTLTVTLVAGTGMGVGVDG